jgi:TolB-like protein
MGLVSELKRRNVIRVAIAYAIAAWLLIEVSATTFPMLRLPEWTATFVTVLLIIGFPVALILAWAFELTPEGLKKERDVDRSQSITHITGRKLDYLIISVLVLTLGYFAFDKFVLDVSREAELVRATTEAVTEQAAKSDKVATDDKSIAVLAFTDLSPAKDQEYFSDGISEELLNVLARIPGLRVAARTSSFTFKGESRDIIDIGQQLNVGHVLEGSVRKSGNQLRITAQLIKADDGFQLWSSSYDRELDDIFVVQDQISAAIVAALKEHLALQVDAAPSVITTANTEAHDAYLRGRHLILQRTRATIEGAVREFEMAIALDPDYALAHAELAVATLLLRRRQYGDLTITEALARAAPHVEQAMALDPNLAEAHAASGFFVWIQNNNEEALTHFEKAVEINPNYSIVYVWMADLLSGRLGRYVEAFRAVEKALQLDPLSIPANYVYVCQLISRGRLAEADLKIEELAFAPSSYASAKGVLESHGGNWANLALGHLNALRFDPGYAPSRNRLTWQFALLGLEKEALTISEGPLPHVLSMLGRPGDAVTTAEARLGEEPMNLLARHNLGLALAGAGDYARARPILEEMWLRAGGLVSRYGLFQTGSAAALITIRRNAGEEAEVGELVAAIRDNARRYREAGITRFDLLSNLLVYESKSGEGLAAYLAGERERGLALIAKAVENGGFVLPMDAYLLALYDDPGFAPIRASQQARQARERGKFLAVVCADNPYEAVWQPAEGTCEEFAAANVN